MPLTVHEQLRREIRRGLREKGMPADELARRIGLKGGPYFAQILNGAPTTERNFERMLKVLDLRLDVVRRERP